MQSVAFTPASAIAAIFAATGQDLGMVGTSSMAHGTARRVDGGIQCGLRLPGLEGWHRRRRDDLPLCAHVARADGLRRHRKVYRFAQIVGAATLALEISASAAMATTGSENFFKAHHERAACARPSAWGRCLKCRYPRHARCAAGSGCDLRLDARDQGRPRNAQTWV